MKSILVVDDDQFIRTILQNMLEFIGYEVVLARDGIEGLKEFLGKHIDLVITDLKMPLMDGGSLAHIIKGKSPNTPIVLVTGSDSKEIHARLKSGSVDSILYKPFKLESILKTIETLLVNPQPRISAGHYGKTESLNQPTFS